MKRNVLVSLVLVLLTLNLSSCLFFGTTFVSHIETAPPEIANQKEMMESMEAAKNNVPETVHDSAEADTTAPETDFPEDAERCTFANGEAELVYTDSEAWIVDHVKSETVSVINIDAMLALADPAGRAGEYFNDYQIKLEHSENERSLWMAIQVTSTTHDAAMKLSCYYLYNPRPTAKRGFEGEYHLMSIHYPGCDEPYTVDSFDRLSELGVTEQSEYYAPVRAFLSCDFSTFEKELYLDEGTLASWDGVVISDYTITRTNMTSPGVSGLMLDITVSESPLERLPAGEYTVAVDTGLFVDFDINPKGGDTPRELSDVERYIYTYASSFGGSFEPEYQNEQSEVWMHCLLDLYLGTSPHDPDKITYDGFRDFCKYGFGVEDASEYYTEDEVLNHGGHGLGTNLCKVRGDFTASGIHFVTVDYFAEPMETVVAFTHEFVVTESNGYYRLDEVRRTYDSGLHPFGWST